MTCVIISDQLVGHLRQCEAVYQCLEEHYRRSGRPADLRLETVVIHKVPKPGAVSGFLFSLLHPRHAKCLACERCMRRSVSAADRALLSAMNPDIVIAPFGKRTTLVARWFAKRCGAKTIAVMNARDFPESYDLVVMHRHDVTELRPNMVVTEGAPNAVRRRAGSPAAQALKQEIGSLRNGIAWLIGGDYKRFRLDAMTVEHIAGELKKAAAMMDGELLITTSRRTPKPVEARLKNLFSGDPKCKLLILANEDDRPEAVPAILSVCRFAVVSPESVSMISEAATSDARVLVWRDDVFLDEDHRKFLNNLNDKGFVEIVPAERTAERLVELSRLPMKEKHLDDEAAVLEGLARIL